MVFRGFLVQRRRRSSLWGRAQADVHVCLTVERSEGKSDGETDRGESVRINQRPDQPVSTRSLQLFSSDQLIF